MSQEFGIYPDHFTCFTLIPQDSSGNEPSPTETRQQGLASMNEERLTKITHLNVIALLGSSFFPYSNIMCENKKGLMKQLYNQSTHF